jgi:hypothetical protein
MLLGRPIRGDVSLYLESLVCKRWGCTPLELEQIPAERVLLEIEFIKQEARAKERLAK